MARVSSRSLIASLLLVLSVPSLTAACGGIASPLATAQPVATVEVAAGATPPAPEPTATEPAPAPIPTPKPTSSPEPTALPDLGQMNEAGQWWDGAGWQSLPQGERWQVSVVEGGAVKAVDASGAEYTWESGGWVRDLPPWNIEEMGALPSVTSTNGEMTLNEDGSVTFKFIVGEKNSTVFGQEFSHTIPALSGVVIDITGAPAGPLSLVVEPLMDREPAIGSNYTPAVKMVNASGEVMAFYDYTSGVWKNTYENLYTGLGQQELAEWMPQELGLLDIYINNQDASNGDFTHIALSGRPIRVFDEHVLYNDKWSKTITWLEAEYNNSGNTLLIAVFDSDDSKMTGMLRVTANEQIDFSRTPHVLDGNFAVPLEKQRVLDLVQASPRIVLNTVIYDPNFLREFNLREWDWRKRDTYPGESVAHNFWRSALQVDANNHALQTEMVEDWLNDTEAVVDNSRWGYIALGVLIQ